MDHAIGPRLDSTFQAYLLACRRLRTEREADRLVDLLVGIVDPTLRLHRFGEHLRSRSVEETVWIFDHLRARVADGDARAQQIGFGLLDRGRWSRSCRPAHLTAAAEALQTTRPPGRGPLRRCPATRRRRRRTALLPRPSEPIGHRISLARRAIAGAVERLLFDPDPRVVRTLLGNPRVTEAEVVKLVRLAAGRPSGLGDRRTGRPVDRAVPGEACPGQQSGHAGPHRAGFVAVSDAPGPAGAVDQRPPRGSSEPGDHAPNRPLKTAHLRRCPASALAATYFQYASLGLRRAAWHLDRFERPGRKEVSYQRAAGSETRASTCGLGWSLNVERCTRSAISGEGSVAWGSS